MPPSPSTRARLATIAVFAAVCGLAAYTFTHLDVTTDITHFLPSSEDRELARIAQEMASSDLNRTITLTLAAPERSIAIAAACDLADRIERRPEVEWVRRGPSEDLQQSFYELYFPRRHLFLGSTEEEIASSLTDPGLLTAAKDLKRRLSSPTGTFVRQIAPRDPLLAFPRHLERLRDAQQGGLTVVSGQLLTRDERHAVIFVASRGSPFESDASRRLLAGIDADLRAVNARHGQTLRLEQSSVHRFALDSEDAIRADVARISIVSMAGVVLLFVFLFGSVRHFALGSLTLGIGAVAGLSATQLLFGRVHGLGLAFGATLIGVAIDYVAHYLNHHTLSPSPEGPAASMRRVWPGLVLAAATTIAALSGLAWTGFPGIRELAVFTCVGVLAALLATRYLIPPWLPFRPTPTRVHVWVARVLGAGLDAVRRTAPLRFGLPALAVMISVLGLARLEWVDDIRVLNALDPALVAEDERVRERVSRMDAGRFVMAWGADEETALRRNDEVYRRLLVASEAGEVDRVRSLASFLPSARTQRESWRALRRAPRLYERLITALDAEGFVTSTFEPFRAELREPAPDPLTWAHIQDTPLGSLVSSFRVDLDDGRVAFVTMMRGGDLPALEARLAGIRGVRLFDQTSFLESAYGQFRTRTLEMIGLGLIAVFLLLFARYRKLLPAIAAFVPAVLAATTSLAIVVLLGYQANLMHLVALLLVLGMGVDYGVFMVEARESPESVGTTLTGLFVACLSTVLSFGLLAMSENPALRALGAISGLGVLLSLVLAPTAWLFVARRPRSEEKDR